jgi:hypothetical protein
MKIQRAMWAITASFALTLSLSQSRAADAMTRFDSRSGSKVRVEGTSSVHDWQLESRLIQGFLEVGPGFPTEAGQTVKPGRIAGSASVFVKISALKSVKKDGSYYDDKMDEIVYDKLKEKTTTNVVFLLEELTMKDSPKASEGVYLLDAKGQVIVAGVTNVVTIPLTISPVAATGTGAGGKKIKISGSVPLKMSAFSIPAESIGLGLFKTGDDVKVLFDWMVGQNAPKPAAAAPK